MFRKLIGLSTVLALVFGLGLSVRDGKIIDIINPWGKRGYNLVEKLVEKISFEKQLGKTVDIDDVALI